MIDVHATHKFIINLFNSILGQAISTPVNNFILIAM